MGISLQSKTVKDFGSTVKGSLVVGDYIYVLSDYLYRCPIDGDDVGEAEVLTDVRGPNSIATDGTYLYVAGFSGSRLNVVSISNFTLLQNTSLAGTGELIGKMLCDNLGFVHLLFNGNYWWIYKYDSELNTLTLVNQVDIGTSTFGMTLYEGDIIINLLSNNTCRYSWDGVNVELVYSNFRQRFSQSENFKGNIIGVHSGGTHTSYQCMVYTTGESEFEKVNSNELNLEGVYQRALAVDGEYAYSWGDNNLWVLEYAGTELSVKQKITFPGWMTSNSFPNYLHCGNNRLYVANGTNLYVMRWSVNAQFTVDKTIGSAPLTVNFVVV